MSVNIKKLGNLNHTESFLQVNTVQGFKYIDKAGEIINRYSDNPSFVPLHIDVNGLMIKKPMVKVEDLKVDSYSVWMKFIEIDSLDMMANIFTKETREILNILSIEKINRIGWRNNFVYELRGSSDLKKYMDKITFIEGTSPIGYALEVGKGGGGDLKGNLFFQPVIKNNDEKTPGILFDIDVFEVGNFNMEDVCKHLEKYRRYLTSGDGFLNVINRFF
ncbi:MAG: hypothetical protein OYG31_01505 [Candidatus Kaiserbacteria bacterium]|nr:hypothetical protein [Candidatus Kaiserbacteria bacterium]